MLGAILVVLLAGALAAFTYLRLERAGPRGWIPLAFRALAWAALGLLLLNVGCPTPGVPKRPLVLLDASLSLGAAGGRWQEARDSARRWGDVLSFGDERTRTDTLPSRGRSLLEPALSAAAATDRPVLVVTDGEIEDARDLPAELLARAGVRLFSRRAAPDLALTAVDGPERVTAGDSIALDVEVQGLNGASADSVRLELVSGNSTVATRRVRLREAASGRARIAFPSAAVGPGDHLVRVRLAGTSDGEPRTDSRLHLVTVAPTPGVVLVAAPADWDSRFLYRTLKDVARLPVRGYARLDANRWRSMADLSTVSPDQVRQAARGADLLILKGASASLGEGSTARGVWRWSSGEDDAAPVPGDWYLAGSDNSPVAGAFLGLPVDSFPPAIQLTPTEPAAGDWVGLTAQLGRRGAARPALVGRAGGRVRRVTTLADGLWRWAFRGGSSEQSYRALVAATASWLLAGADSAIGPARPVRRVAQQGRPVVFEWAAPGAGTPTPITLNGPEGPRPDTLRFDGAGRARLWLPPGWYRYRFAGGAGGSVAVEEYSDELVPRPDTLQARSARAQRPAGRTVARDWLWLFGLCIAALAGEWLARRRLGLR
jgi:hypothetical protein